MKNQEHKQLEMLKKENEDDESEQAGYLGEELGVDKSIK